MAAGQPYLAAWRTKPFVTLPGCRSRSLQPPTGQTSWTRRSCAQVGRCLRQRTAAGTQPRPHAKALGTKQLAAAWLLPASRSPMPRAAEPCLSMLPAVSGPLCTLLFQAAQPPERVACRRPCGLAPAGRLDRKIEFPHPNEEARAKILQVCLPAAAARRRLQGLHSLVKRRRGAWCFAPAARRGSLKGLGRASVLLPPVCAAHRCSLSDPRHRAPCRSTPAR